MPTDAIHILNSPEKNNKRSPSRAEIDREIVRVDSAIERLRAEVWPAAAALVPLGNVSRAVAIKSLLRYRQRLVRR